MKQKAKKAKNAKAEQDIELIFSRFEDAHESDATASCCYECTGCFATQNTECVGFGEACTVTSQPRRSTSRETSTTDASTEETLLFDVDSDVDGIDMMGNDWS